MVISIWSFFGILAFGAFLGLIGYRFVNYIKLLNTCTTCGSQHNDKSTLIQCPICKQWFCSDNVERVEEAYTSVDGIISIIPSSRIPEYPCGTKYLFMGELEGVSCKKHSKRVPYRIKIPLDK